ncbi:MAG: FAD binding domain-containing protein [Ancalomicrobiaceae bacterium]|nr:FAD binding domain-containing protein [Ancalomicrobiaceae bacterium]
MLLQNRESLHVASNLPDALAALHDLGPEGAPIAGATWIMRAPIRQEGFAKAYVALTRIPDLRQCDINAEDIVIGACVTHDELAHALAGLADLKVLADAAARSANPAIRRVATVGGNLCSFDFAAADLVCALLCLDATVELRSRQGSDRMSIEQFLEQRLTIEPGTLIARVIVRRRPRRSAHVRLPLRKAGDYPVAIVSMAITSGCGDAAETVSIAVGSVERQARRWARLEADVTGKTLSAERIGELAEAYAGDFTGRDDIDAPGWYRVKVLPSLVRRAARELTGLG